MVLKLTKPSKLYHGNSYTEEQTLIPPVRAKNMKVTVDSRQKFIDTNSSDIFSQSSVS